VVVAIGFQIANSKFLGAQNLVNLFEQSTIYIAAGDRRDLRPATRRDRPLRRPGHGAEQRRGRRTCAADRRATWPWWAAIIVALLASTAFGAIQGTLVSRLKMPSFIVTLGGLLILEGVAIIVLGGSLVGIGNGGYKNEVYLYNIFWGTFSPLVSWILLVVLVGAAGAGLWLQDARKRRAAWRPRRAA